MKSFYAQDGQSMLDVALNTYGSLDRVVKLAKDNGLSSLLAPPTTRQPFTYDETLANRRAFRALSSGVDNAPIASLFANGYGRLISPGGGYCVDAGGYYCIQANPVLSSVDTGGAGSMVDHLSSDYLTSDYL